MDGSTSTEVLVSDNYPKGSLLTVEHARPLGLIGLAANVDDEKIEIM